MIKLLGNNQKSPNLPEYFGSDTIELHEKNCDKLGHRWKYSRKKVLYNLNKHRLEHLTLTMYNGIEVLQYLVVQIYLVQDN